MSGKASRSMNSFRRRMRFFDYSPKGTLRARCALSPVAGVFYGEQRMDTLSGGEKVKAQLLRIFLERPTVLLLDEPSNDLDLATLELLESLINEWEGIVLFTSHDETLIERTATVVIHLEQLKRKSESRYAVVRDTYARYRQQRAELFARKTQQAENERKEKRLRDENTRGSTTRWSERFQVFPVRHRARERT